MFEKTIKLCDSFLEHGVPGFDLAVYHDGACVLRHWNGYSDLENGVKMQGNERYNIYSCSKPITCTAALQLWEKGLFSLEDRLADYMPEFAEMTVKSDDGVRKAEKPILIRHLFEMTAGLSYALHTPQLEKCRVETGGRCPTRETMKYLAKEPLLFEPGERWEYSLCHDALAALVEVISGEKFEVYVRKHIFDVLGMNDSTFLLPKSEAETITPQYRFENGKPVNVGKWIVEYQIGDEYASGGASCRATVDDYMKFLEGLRTGKLLTPDTLDLMSTDRLTDQQKSTYWMTDTNGYGLGVRCPMIGGDETEFGWGGAAGAYLAVDRQNALSIYLGMHLMGSPVQGLHGVLYRLIRAELTGRSCDAVLNELETKFNYHFEG